MKRPLSRPSPGFTLIELMVSLGVFIFAITTVVASIGAAGNQAAEESRRTLGVSLLNDCFRDISSVGGQDSARSPLFGLSAVNWSSEPETRTLWFDARGSKVESADKAFFRCEITPSVGTVARLGHLRGRIVWPALRRKGLADGEVELFTSLLLP